MSDSKQRFPVEVQFGENGLGLFESRHEEGFFMDWRRDPFPKVLMVISGEGVVMRGSSSLAVRASSLLVVPAMARHRIADVAGRPLVLVGICLRDPGFVSGATLHAAVSLWRIETDSVLSRSIRDLIREILVEERSGRVGAADLQQALTVRILVALARTPAKVSVGRADSALRVESYVAALDLDFWRGDSLDAVAAAQGLSRRRFTQLFKQITGETWLQRLNRLRLNHASRLLCTTRLPVRAVAFECGYSDLSHFYRLFRSRFGMSPARWRSKGTAAIPPKFPHPGPESQMSHP